MISKASVALQKHLTDLLCFIQSSILILKFGVFVGLENLNYIGIKLFSLVDRKPLLKFLVTLKSELNI